MTTKPRRANLKGQGQCVFCGGLGLTHEHIWADWLREFIPRGMEYHTIREAEVDPFLPEKVALKRRTGDFHARRIRRVCQPCNNGWMSRLQEQARPFLAPMLIGEATTLQRRAQTTLAAWTAVMVMAAEFVSRDRVAIPQSDRDFIREHKKPPNHWRIWIGAQSNQNVPLYTHNVLFFAEEEIQALPGDATCGQNTQTTTICLGQHLLIHVMSSIPAKSIIRRWVHPGGIQRGLNQIWPVRNAPLSWKTSPRLNDAGIVLLADDFLNRSITFLRRRAGEPT